MIMKKQILFILAALPICLFSQKIANPNIKVGNVGKPQEIKKTTPKVIVSSDSSSNQSQKVTPKPFSNKRQFVPYSFVKIGNTLYDLQTNASMGRRIHLLPNGNVSAVWTTSDNGAPGFTNRGTGYNSFNGTNWGTVTFPTPRLEGARIGWPSIGINGTNEWVMGHNAADGGFIKSNNTGIGSTTWTSGSLVLTQPQRRPIWGRVMNNGNYFHCISNYADSGAVGEPRAPRIKGVLAPTTYSRSTDGGVTWSTQHILLPGYDSSRVINGGGDQYAIDVRDSIVAIVIGDALEDVKLWKSTDNGATFTFTIMDSFKYAPYTSKKLMLDTPFVCDGSLDVLIDNQGKVHAFWGTTRVFDDDTTNETYSFFPGTALLSYWNENNKETTLIAGGNQFDRTKDNVLTFTQGSISALTNGNIPSGLSSVSRLGNTALLHMPSAGIDEDGNIFCTFSLVVEDDIDLNNLNFRDIMMVHSTDGGDTWEDPIDVTQITQKEEEFGCIARRVNDFVHLIFQMDETPGTNLQSNSSNANNHPVPASGNDIMYAAIPVAKILDGSIGRLWPTAVEQFDANKEIFVVSQNYPNPFDKTSEVLIWLNSSSDVTVEVFNLDGKIVSTQNYNNLNAGNHQLTINGETLSSGIYFYNIKTATHSVTKKMIIE